MTNLLQSPLLAILAAVVTTLCLVGLHRLRVRPVRHRVATTQFWSAANPAQNRRTLLGRFSHWRTFLLLLSALLLLSLGLSGWAGIKAAESRGQTIVIVDTGFSMAAADAGGETHLARAIGQAKADIAALGGGWVALIEASDRATLRTDGWVPGSALSRSLDRLVASAVPSDQEAALRLAFNLLPDGAGRVLYYTNHPKIADSLPREWQVRLDVRRVGDSVPNAAIVNVAIIPDADDAIVGTLEARVAMWNGDPASVALQLLDTEGGVLATHSLDTSATGETVSRFPKLRLDGRALELRITGSKGPEADNSVTLTLPRRTPIVFRVQGEVPTQLRRALNVIGNVVDNADGADTPSEGTSIFVTDEQIAGPLLSIQIVSSGSSRVEADTPVTTAGDELASGLDLEQAVAGPGSGIDTAGRTMLPLLMAGDAVLAAMDMLDGPRLLLSDAVYSSGSSIATRPAFFILLQRASERLAGWTPVPRSLPFSRQTVDPLNGTSSRVPPITLVGNREQSDTSQAAAALAPVQDLSTTRSVLPSWWTVALAAALALLLVEGFLYAKGRIV